MSNHNQPLLNLKIEKVPNIKLKVNVGLYICAREQNDC